ncbi:hypothetical protein LCGC14_0693850 [marine sediment metagenome]|uniref:Uncharacterized protein n=1 Tax=marine sediment metagenome TaxID=412755 RepID=A0A0F9QPP3_9ZZZZ
MADVGDDHSHEWGFSRGVCICGDPGCAIILSTQDVAARLNDWIRLDDEDWKRRIMMGRLRLEEADGRA